MGVTPGTKLALAVVLMTSAAGCAHPLRCEREGGEPWWRVRSPHIVLDTNSSRAEGERVIRRLEVLGDALSHFLTGRPLGLNMHVAMFHDELQFGRFFEKGVKAITIQPRWFDPEQAPLLVVSEANMGILGHLGRELETEDFVHEATHRILWQFASQVPRWVNEGLAMLCMTMQVKDGEVTIGRGSPDWQSYYPAPKAHEVISSPVSFFLDPEPPGRIGAYYLASWTLVHMLMDDHLKAMTDYLRRLSAGESPREAWSGTVGQFDEAMLDDALEHYRRQGHVTTWRFPAPAPADIAVESAPLADREVHLLWLRMVGRPAQYETKVQLTAAEMHLPAGDAGLSRYQIALALVRDDRAGAEAAARALLARQPESAFAWESLARIAVDAVESSAADAEARVAEVLPQLTRHASTPSALRLTALLLAFQGRLQQAIPFAHRAVEKDGACVDCLNTLAVLLEAGGNKPGALEALEAAVARAPDTADPAALGKLESRANRIREELKHAQH